MFVLFQFYFLILILFHSHNPSFVCSLHIFFISHPIPKSIFLLFLQFLLRIFFLVLLLLLCSKIFGESALLFPRLLNKFRYVIKTFWKKYKKFGLAKICLPWVLIQTTQIIHLVLGFVTILRFKRGSLMHFKYLIIEKSIHIVFNKLFS